MKPVSLHRRLVIGCFSSQAVLDAQKNIQLCSLSSRKAFSVFHDDPFNMTHFSHPSSFSIFSLFFCAALPSYPPLATSVGDLERRARFEYRHHCQRGCQEGLLPQCRKHQCCREFLCNTLGSPIWKTRATSGTLPPSRCAAAFQRFHTRRTTASCRCSVLTSPAN